MPIFTIISDWYKNDFYAGALKGMIISECKGAQIFDISHQIESFNIAQAAFVLRNSFQRFPKGTIHLICVNSEADKNRQYLIVKAEDHYFIGADNGIFGLILKNAPQKIYQIKVKDDEINSFPELSVFTRCACHIALEKKITDIAVEIKDYYKQIPLRPAIDDNTISGSVIYIDSYQNVVTNITKELFDRIGENKAYDIFVQSHHYKISKINKKYKETTPGELLAIFNSVGLLEIAINNGNAAELLGLEVGANIRVKFK